MNKIDELLEYVQRTNPEMTMEKLIKELVNIIDNQWNLNIKIFIWNMILKM